MDHKGFDTLTRVMADGDTTRRAALRFISGGLLGVLAARLGLPEDAAAKQKQRKRRPAPQKEGALRAEGTRKGKKGKGKKKPRSKPRDCYSDAACGACQEEFCNPETNSWECRRTCQLESSVCCKGQCFVPCSGEREIDPETCQCGCRAGEWQCADGSCVSQDQCCDDEKPCAGGVCVSADQCCPGEKRCNDGSCIPEDECCWDNPPPCGSGCNRMVCVDGELQCQPLALGWPCRLRGGDDGTCCNGQCTKEAIVCPSYPLRRFDESTCECACPGGGTDIPGSNNRLCCPAGYPRHDNIGKCWQPDSNEWVCAIGYHKCTPQDPPQSVRVLPGLTGDASAREYVVETIPRHIPGPSPERERGLADLHGTVRPEEAPGAQSSKGHKE
jgi:hypothetical protein